MESRNHFAYGLNDKIAIKAAADSLASHLDKEFAKHSDAIGWTAANFAALDSFLPADLELKSFHKTKGYEFLWDYIASDGKQGIYLVAESEKATGIRDYESFPLKHDFEKLLYVFAPLHLVICGARNFEDAERIARELANYAKGCSQNFQAGCVFILYCRVTEGKNASYIWQAEGQPHSMSFGHISFPISEELDSSSLPSSVS